MNKKQQLIEYLKRNYVPGQISWTEIAEKFGYDSPEVPRSLWKAHRKASGTTTTLPAFVADDSVSTRKGNLEAGTIESQVTSDFEPKTEQELAELHKIDLKKYKIKNYWSKILPSGKFTSSVFCVERKLGGGISKEEVAEAVAEFIKSPKVSVAKPKVKKKSTKHLVFFVADEHVGAANDDGLYDNDWNESEYLRRKMALVDVASKQSAAHGDFKSISICNLGDTLDGFSEQTTRGGHKVPQNMTNKQAILTYLKVGSAVWDALFDLNIADEFYQYNVENSNHGGLGWDAAANIALDTYLSTKYIGFETVAFEKIIGSLKIGGHDIHLTHGKDEKYMKRNLPLHLDARTESYLKEYLEENDFSHKKAPQHFFKGDLHKFATEQGKYFSYTNVPSLFGSSAWVMANFGNTKPGFCYAIVDEDDRNLAVNPYWF